MKSSLLVSLCITSKVLIAAMLFLFSLSVFSQSHSNLADTGNNLQTDALFRDYNITFRNIYMDSQKKKDNDESRSVYLKNEWDNELVLNTIDGKSFKLGSSNFNISNNVFEVEAGKDSVFVMQSSAIKRIKFNGVEFIKTKYNDFYYELLYHGEKIKILKKYAFKLKEGAVNALTNEKVRDDKVIITDALFIDINDNIEKVELKKKSVLNVLRDRQAEIIEYQKKEKISFKKQKGVVRLLKYYDSL